MSRFSHPSCCELLTEPFSGLLSFKSCKWVSWGMDKIWILSFLTRLKYRHRYERNGPFGPISGLNGLIQSPDREAPAAFGTSALLREKFVFILNLMIPPISSAQPFRKSAA